MPCQTLLASLQERYQVIVCQVEQHPLRPDSIVPTCAMPQDMQDDTSCEKAEMAESECAPPLLGLELF